MAFDFNSQLLGFAAAACSLITTLCAVFAIFWGYHTFKKQKTSSDIEIVLHMFDKVNGYWDLYICANEKDKKDFYFGQILVYYENACFLSNRKVISQLAFESLSHHIYEIWKRIDEEGDNSVLNDYKSSPTTFSEVRLFINNYENTKTE